MNTPQHLLTLGLQRVQRPRSINRLLSLNNPKVSSDELLAARVHGDHFDTKRTETNTPEPRGHCDFRWSGAMFQSHDIPSLREPRAVSGSGDRATATRFPGTDTACGFCKPGNDGFHGNRKPYGSRLPVLHGNRRLSVSGSRWLTVSVNRWPTVHGNRWPTVSRNPWLSVSASQWFTVSVNQ